jgi:hypothetical protein
MSEHLNEHSVELYHQQRLPAGELMEADAHLSACPSCRMHLKKLERTGAAIEQLRTGLDLEEALEPEHPHYAQFTAYAEHRLDEVDREIMDSHMEICAQCAEVMRELRAFVIAPAPIVEERLAEKKAGPSISLRDRFTSFWSAQTEWMSWQFAGAAAGLLLLAGVSAAVWLSLKRTPQESEVARVTPSPVLEQQPSQLNPPASPATTPAVASTANTSNNINVQQAPPSSKERTPSTNASIDGGAYATVALKDGGRAITIDGKGNINGIEGLSEADRQAVRKALVTERVEAPSTLASLVGSVGVLRGGNSEGISFPILNPVGTVVMTERPVLRWGRLEGATSYVVSVFDRNFKRVAISQPQPGTEWTVTTPLARGSAYTWQVTALRNGEEVTSPAAPAPEAKFMVLDEGQAARITRAREAYSDSHLTLGTLYASAGLLDEAEREFQLLLKENPQSPVARKLLDSVRALRTSK